MLIEFKVANYRSIRTEQTLSMVANSDKELPQNLISCDHVPGLKGTKLVKAVALYGANASGKSNIVAALRFFAEFVRDSATKLQPGAPTGAQPFKLDPACLTQPSKFEITAVINGIRTLYGIEMTRERVTSEYLVAYPKGRPQVWFERDWDEGKGKYTWSKSTGHFKHDAALREKARENAAFVSVAAQFGVEAAMSITKWFRRPSDLMLAEDQQRLFFTLRMLLGNPKLRPHFETLVLTADLGIAGIQIDEVELDKRIETFARGIVGDKTNASEFAEKIKRAFASYEGRLEELPKDHVLKRIETNLVIPRLLHFGKGGAQIGLDFETEESSGTGRYLDLMAKLVVSLKEKSFAVFDEIEASLHPALVKSLCEKFLRASSDTSPSQLIFTTHNPLLLDQTLLRRDQIWFTEKDQEGATRLYPLTDFKPRKDESLVKGYLAGRYGGIPFIPEGLKF